MFHIAAINQNHLALEYLLSIWPPDSLSFDLTIRNKKGETPYSIAHDLKSEKVIKVLEEKQKSIEDVSKKTTDDLLQALLDEEAKKEQDKAKKKEKK